MKRKIGYLFIAVFTFMVGVVISPIRFSPTVFACGRRASSVRYTSSYFVTLLSNSKEYDSVEQANEAFQVRLNKSQKVIDRTAKFDNTGREVGHRAVIVFRGEDNTEYFGVLWTDGKFLCCEFSSSLRHVLQFEKRHLRV